MLEREQRDFYRENGYLLVEGLLSKEEAASLRQESHALLERLAKHHDTDATWGSARQSTMTATVLKHCHDVQFYAAAFSRLIVDEQLTSVAADLMEMPNVQLHHTTMFVKPPEKGSPFPMHQDQPFFPHQRHSMMAVILHFDDAPLEKGCLRVVPGSHKLGPLPHEAAGGWHLPFEQYPLESATACPAEAGDALFFSYSTIHGSGVNTSNEARRMLGEYVMTQHDLMKRRRKYDAVGLGSYHIDVRHTQRTWEYLHLHPRLVPAVFNEGYLSVPVEPYEIPYRALLPPYQCENLLVPICLSASHVVFASVRMEPQYMVLGHSAGVAAALAVCRNIPVHHVGIGTLQACLRQARQVLSLGQLRTA